MKKIILLISFYLIIIETNAQSPTFEWAKPLGGTSQDQTRSMDIDKYGNTYTLGWFQGTVDLDPGLGTYNITSYGSFDVFISKLDNNGNFIWAKQIGGSWIDIGTSVKVDSLCNVYVDGSFNNTVDFDPGPGIYNLTSTGGFAVGNTFILKLNANGDFIWAKQINGYANKGNNARSITLDQESNVFITGLFVGSADFDPGVSTYSLTAGGTSNAFISKLDSGGNFIWVKQFTTDSSVVPVDLEVDKKGNIYSIGTFNGTADFDPGIGVHNLASTGDYDIYISKLNNTGDFIWAKQFSGPYKKTPRDLTVDKYGSVYSTGTFSGTVDFNPNGVFNLTSFGGNDLFLSKLDSVGDFIWAKQLGGINHDIGSAVVIDEEINMYVVGGFSDTVDFNLNNGTFYLHTINYLSNSFILKLDSLTNLKWVLQIQGSNSASHLKIDRNKALYISSAFSGTCDFDPGSNIFNVTSSGGSDICIYKMSQQTTVGLNQNESMNNINIYPNPNNGKLNLIVLNLKFKNLRLEIYNCLGELVLKNIIENEKNSIDLTNQVDGIYFIKVISDNSTLFSQKILKQ